MNNTEKLTDAIAEKLAKKIGMPKPLMINAAYEIVFFGSKEDKKPFKKLFDKYMENK